MSSSLKDDWEKIVVEQLGRPYVKNFAQLKTDLERFKFCRAILRHDFEAQEFIQNAHRVVNKRRNQTGKSLEKSQQFLASADDCVNKKQFRKAVSLYSKGLQYLPHKRCTLMSEGGPLEINGQTECRSTKLSIASILTRRAEALFMVGEYQACLNDIQEASSHQYNYTNSDQLIKMQKACLKKQDRTAKANTGTSNASRVPNLAGGYHHAIANGSRLIDINYDPKQGRYLWASDEIRAGDALIAEKPFTAVLLPENNETHCHNCFKTLIAPFTCQRCCSVLYCSPSCCKKAWVDYHSIECSLLPVLEIIDTFAHLSLRILLTAGPNEILTVLKEFAAIAKNNEMPKDSIAAESTFNASYPADYISVFSLVTNTELQPIKALMSYSLNAAFLMEFLEDSFTLTKSQRLRSHGSDHNVPNLGQTELDSDDDSEISCDSCPSCEQERAVSNKRTRSEATSELKCTKMPLDNPVKCSTTLKSLGLSNEDFLNTLTEEIVGSLLLHHQQQMPCNVHAITAIVSTSSSDEENEDECRGLASPGQVITREQRRIGTAIYPTASLINHACDPDIIVSFINDVLVVRATHNISTGSAINHCYGPNASRMPREERQKVLFKQYFFTCQCSACTRDEEMENRLLCFTAFACQSCKGPIKPSIMDMSVGRCKDCNTEKSLEKELRLAQEAELLFCKGLRLLERVGVHEALQVFLECLRIRRQILYQYNKDLAETHDAAARCYAMIGDYKKATHHCLQSSEAVEKAYGSSSVEYGHELHKLSQLMFNDQQVKKALVIVEKAISLLGTHYGSCHPDVEELGEMKKCLTSVNRGDGW